jgi:UDP:flavonoid glycosyltransferase YjiC (YdhE family)
LLADEINSVLSTPAMKIKAEELSLVMKKENGVQAAVNLIHEYFCKKENLV